MANFIYGLFRRRYLGLRPRIPPHAQAAPQSLQESVWRMNRLPKKQSCGERRRGEAREARASQEKPKLDGGGLAWSFS